MARKKATEAVASTESIVAEQSAPKQTKTTNTAKGTKFKVKQNLTPHTYVPVRNGFNGKLIYRSPHTGETFVWEGFGEEQDMELQELKFAKSSSKVFFENNWFLIDDPEVIEYLGVERFYENALSYDEFEDLFSKSVGEIEERVRALSDGQKQSLAYKARKMILEEKIDSIKTITALEKCLDIELIER